MSDTERSHAPARRRIAGLVVLVVLAAAGCSSDEPVMTTPRAANLPSQEVTDFEMKESDTGKPEWILVSKYAATYTGGLIVARDVVIDFYDRGGHPNPGLDAIGCCE